MKYLLIIGDGMADNPIAKLDGRTPLEVAEKPNIDEMAYNGQLGRVKTVPDGYPPGSDVAIMSIFGAAPNKYFAGRAPLEAAAQDIALSPGDAAFRCNIASLSDADSFTERKMLSHSAGGISGEEARALVEDLMLDEKFIQQAKNAGLQIYPDNSYRHLSVQKQVDIGGLVLHAPHENLNKSVADILPSGCDNADILTALMVTACEILDRHPINIARREAGKLPGNVIWFWAEGTAAALPNFYDQFGKTGAVISAVPLCHGIAKLTGLSVVLVPGATAEIDTNYEGKVSATVAALSTRDFACIHIEAPDECSHNGELDNKIKSIELIDSRVVAPILQMMQGQDFRALVISDHKTLLETGNHNEDPVPYIIYDSRNDIGSGLKYTEKDAENTELLEDGTKLMELLFEI